MVTFHPNGQNLTAVWNQIRTRLEPSLNITERQFYDWALGMPRFWEFYTPEYRKDTTDDDGNLVPVVYNFVAKVGNPRADFARSEHGRSREWFNVNYRHGQCPCAQVGCDHEISLECKMLSDDDRHPECCSEMCT